MAGNDAERGHSSLSDKFKALIAEDRLGFTPYVDALVDLILDPLTDTPLTVGIFGPWGSGKTSLMRMVQDGVTQKKPFPVVWFDAWKYDKEAVLWRALLIRVLEALRPAASEKETKEEREEREQLNRRLDDLQGSLYRIVEREEPGNLRLDWGELAKGVVKGGIHVGLNFLPVLGGLLPKFLEKSQEEAAAGDLDHLTTFLAGIQRERLKVFREHVTSLEQFQQEFGRLVSDLVVGPGKKLIVFVDDLDRCLPEKAVEVLEAIKLFLDVDGCIFLLGIDHQVIARGVEIRYRELGLQKDGEERRDLIDGKKYLEKIIQLPFHIPVIDREHLLEFVAGLATGWPDVEAGKGLESECARVFSKVVEDNPRLSETLQRYAGRRVLRDLLTLHPPEMEGANFTRLDAQGQSVRLSPDECRIYFTLSGRTEAAGPAAIPAEAFEPATVPVPEGPFQMGTNREDFEAMGIEILENEIPRHEVWLSPYRIGVHPVKNYEYQAFVKESGHRAPAGWDGDAFPEGRDDHPVVNVSWDDAEAYCAWLRAKTGRNYRLPTEAQWEKAGRGTDGRFYPWGNDWDPSRLNSREGGPGDTTPAGQYSPAGDSPYGAADMAGNVWEWCADWYDEAAYRNRPAGEVRDPKGPESGTFRVQRGGAFDGGRHYCRCACRYHFDPLYRLDTVGFRIFLLPSDVPRI